MPPTSDLQLTAVLSAGAQARNDELMLSEHD